jgi:dienelactone hydrolase
MMAARNAILSIVGLFLVAALLLGPADGADRPSRSNESPPARLFLDVFRTPGEAIVVESVALGTAASERASLVRPKSDERLPGLLLIADGATPEFFAQSAQELAGIGYAVLIVPAAKADNVAGRIERTTATAGKAARWLKQRKDVFRERIGVLGWGFTAICALQVAAAESTQATVLVDFENARMIDDRLAAGLDRTAVLFVQGNVGKGDRFRKLVASGHREHRVFKLAGAKAGFMDCRSGDSFDSKAADRAWFEIYEFVGKYVEDADLRPSVAQHNSTVEKSSLHFTSIADAMRKANGTTGVRTVVARALNEGPRDERDWKLLREQSRLLVQCGDWLASQTPRKGNAATWRRQAATYRDAAQALAEAAKRSNRSDTEAALSRLNLSCARCHAEHR